jgi:ketosteroid isomerase-like protein
VVQTLHFTDREKIMDALEVALAYHRAWAAHDVDAAMAYIAEDVVLDAPAGRIEGAAAYRAFLTPYVDMLVSAELLAAYGDSDKAVVVYGSATKLVADAPGAEYVTVRDGKITYSRFIFDRLPFYEARSR